MKPFKADLHIHTVLSPCGDLEMSPGNIIAHAKAKGIDMIGITDHNCTLQAEISCKIGEDQGIFVLRGVEITTKEEIHCLAFFETNEERHAFQLYLDEHLPFIKNNPDKFGFQLVVDEDEQIIEEKESLLISALDEDMNQIYKKVKSLNGIFIPAHINKKANSLISQLGFVPPDIKADALELSKHITKAEFIKKAAYLKRFPFIQSSDAHYPEAIGEVFSIFHMHSLSFAEFRKTLSAEDGRFVEIPY